VGLVVGFITGWLMGKLRGGGTVAVSKVTAKPMPPNWLASGTVTYDTGMTLVSLDSQAFTTKPTTFVAPTGPGNSATGASPYNYSGLEIKTNLSSGWAVVWATLNDMSGNPKKIHSDPFQFTG
jgi:hypothetical protein